MNVDARPRRNWQKTHWCRRARSTIACIASVSNRVIARKLEREYSFFLLSSRRSRRTRAETLATQATRDHNRTLSYYNRLTLVLYYSHKHQQSVRAIFVWPWNEKARTKRKQQTNGNSANWMVYRTDTNTRGCWLVKWTLGWKNFMPENF